MRVPGHQLTTNFSANCQLTTISLANCQLTTNFSKLLTFIFLQRKILHHNPNFLYFSTPISFGGRTLLKPRYKLFEFT